KKISFLHSSLGRSTNANAYTEYRSIVGTMGLSKNLRTLTLYSGMLGAFLENLDNLSNNNRWYHNSLQPAAPTKQSLSSQLFYSNKTTFKLSSSAIFHYLSVSAE